MFSCLMVNYTHYWNDFVLNKQICCCFRIVLAMKDHDSTVVYYRMTQGLVPPDSPETAHRKKQCDEQKHLIDIELHRMQHKLLDRALKAALSDKVRTYTGNEQETSNSGSTIAAAEEQVNSESAGD